MSRSMSMKKRKNYIAEKEKSKFILSKCKQIRSIYTMNRWFTISQVKPFED